MNRLEKRQQFLKEFIEKRNGKEKSFEVYGVLESRFI